MAPWCAQEVQLKAFFSQTFDTWLRFANVSSRRGIGLHQPVFAF